MSAVLKAISRAPRIPEGLTPLNILAEAVPMNPPVRPKGPPQLAAWQKAVEEHQLGWRYEYTGDETAHYIRRKGVWEYEELQIDCLGQLEALPEHPATAPAVKKLIEEVERLAKLFDAQEDRMEKAMDDFHFYTEEILDASGKESPEETAQLARIVLAHTDILTGKLDKIYEKVIGEWEIFHRCSLKFTAHWPLPYPSLGKKEVPNFFGGPPFNMETDRAAAAALYQTYRTILDIHGIYISRFLSTVIHTRSLVGQPVPWLRSKASVAGNQTNVQLS